MTHLSELDNTLFLINRGILQKKETFYSVTAMSVVNIGKYLLSMRLKQLRAVTRNCEIAKLAKCLANFQVCGES